MFPLSKIRGSAIVRQVGGVGYYPRSGVSGFIHIDSGNVRYWPRPNATQMADIVRDFRKTVGARMTNGYMVAQGAVGPPGRSAIRARHTWPSPSTMPTPPTSGCRRLASAS